MRIPAKFIAGDLISWTDYSFADNNGNSIAAPTWSLSYSVRGPVATAGFDLTGTASGSGWTFSATAAQTAALNTTTAANVWYWQAYAANGAQRISAGQGTLRVYPNLQALSAGSTFDGRSQAEQILATVEAAILARTTGDLVTKYTIGARSLEKEPIEALLTLRSRYRLIVARERAAQSVANGLGNPNRLQVRFSPR